MWAVSDDRGQNNEPRLYSFKISIDGLEGFSPSKIGNSVHEDGASGYNFSLKPTGVLFLRASSQGVSKRMQIDAEGIAPFENGFLISSEGNYQEIPRRNPSLMFFNSEGFFNREIYWPAEFEPNPTGKQRKGLRGNYAFEGLSISPDQKNLFAIHEAPLVQNNPSWRASELGEVHLLRFKVPSGPNLIKSTPFKSNSFKSNPIKSSRIESNRIEVDKDILYKLDAYKAEAGKVLASGVSEILALSGDKLLVLERAIFFSPVDFFRYESRVYEVSFANPSDKKLVLDLDKIKRLLKSTKELDNFEGMALGPIVNSQPTLLMVSDDNFNPLENTIWLIFKLNLEP
jgi:hypothetical protein